MPSHSTRQSAFRHWASGRFDRETAFSIGDAAFEINTRAKSRVSDWRQNRFPSRAFPGLSCSVWAQILQFGRNRRRETAREKKKACQTRPCNSSTRAAHARKRAWTETGTVERRSRTLDAHLRGLHVRFPPPATRARRETTSRDRCRTTRAITSRNIGRDGWPPHAPRRAPATATPELSRSIVDSALHAAFEANARARGVLFGAYRGSFPAKARVEFFDRTVRRFGCSDARADTPLPSLVVPAA